MRPPNGFLPLRLIPKTVLIPWIFLLCIGLGGAPNLHQAFSDHYFFQAQTWWAPLASLAIFNLCIMFYLHPVFALAACGDQIPQGVRVMTKVAVKRFRFLPIATILFATATLFSGDAFAAMRQPVSAGFGTFSMLKVFVNLGGGLFLGVLVHFFLENALFETKKRIHELAPELPKPYQSLFFKIFLVLAAITIQLVVQAVSVFPSFVMLERPTDALGAAMTGVHPALDPNAEGSLLWMKKNADVLFNPSLYGAKDLLEVFYLQMAVYLGFILMMLGQIKALIRTPLNTITGRLKDLNRGRPEDLCTIDVVENDEFASVFTEINRLIDKQQSALNASQEQLSTMVAQAADPIVVFDAKGTIHLFNPAAQAFFGYSESEALQTNFTHLIDLPEEVACECETDALPMIHYLLEEGPALARHQGLHKSGARKPFESNISTTQTPSGPLYTAILRDIAAQLLFENSLTQAKVEAENANRMKSEFLANMSHELRTPLNAVLGFTQLLDNDKNLTDGQREKIRTISRSGEHLLDLINDILDISKIEAGKIEMHDTIFDLRAFVADVHDMFSLRAKKKGLNLDVEILEGLPQFVRGDLGKLRQVIINLVGNAIKFTTEGGVGVVVGPDSGRIRFAVNDSGRGIPSGELDSILQPFVQSSITDHEGGTGLGLAISSRFIAMMGGKLQITSEVGKGSTFTFDVSLQETEERPEASEPQITSAAIKAGTSVLALIVDDKVTNRLILKEMLEGAGFAVMEAENGRQAVERAHEFLPQLVFMDIKMPILDGYAAVAQLKDDDKTRPIPVFALTASAFKHDEQRIQDAGFDGFLAKPFKQSALFRLIHDKTDVELEYEIADSDEAVSEAEPVDYFSVRAKLGESGIANLEELALINDFAAVRRLAEDWRQDLPSFSHSLKALASSFDESGLQREIAAVKAAQVGAP